MSGLAVSVAGYTAIKANFFDQALAQVVFELVLLAVLALIARSHGRWNRG
ncbi:hypothetical protein [Microbulbifer sp. SH-1]|nr:hypothetical protein [Microbulbifer sp. SH-1]